MRMIKFLLLGALLFAQTADAFIKPGIFRRVRSAVVKLYQGQKRVGTGFYVRHSFTKKSLIVTAAHVCYTAKQLHPTYKPMPVLAIDFASDVCVLDPGNAGADVAHLYLAPKKPEHGDTVLAVGFPGNGKYMANASRFLGSVRPHTYRLFSESGIIKQQKPCPGKIKAMPGIRMCMVTISHVEDITPTLQSGMSGGPTVNTEGHVVGVNALKEPEFNIGSISTLDKIKEAVNAAVRTQK